MRNSGLPLGAPFPLATGEALPKRCGIALRRRGGHPPEMSAKSGPPQQSSHVSPSRALFVAAAARPQTFDIPPSWVHPHSAPDLPPVWHRGGGNVCWCRARVQHNTQHVQSQEGKVCQEPRRLSQRVGGRSVQRTLLRGREPPPPPAPFLMRGLLMTRQRHAPPPRSKTDGS